MTTTTPDTVLIETPQTRRSSTRLRFAVAFLIGLIASMAIGVGALYAYDRQYVGRILPGVAVGSLDVSGLDAVAAGAAIRQVYGYLGEGSVTFKTRDNERTITFAEIGRGPDVDAMVAEALAVGRDGNAVERFIADARTALRGVSLTPKVTFDADALAEHGLAFADSLAREPQDAWVAVVDKEFAVVPAIDGRLADPAVPVEAALADLGELDAPPELTYEMPVRSVPSATTTDEATIAKTDAERITAPILFAGKAQDQQITAARLRTWLSFAPTADGGYGVSVDTSGLEALLKTVAKNVDRAPVNASFSTSGSRITGVTESKTGYKLDQAATKQQVQDLIDARIAGGRRPRSSRRSRSSSRD